MVKKPIYFSIFILLFTLLGCAEKHTQTIRIATAANMQYAMRELIKEFSAHHKIGCDMIVSSSGKLTGQITAGAPYDIFVSADMKYPEEIFEKGLSFEKPKVYAYGQLVLWTTTDSISPTLETLKQDHIQHIAVSNPKTAPYGVAAMQVLDKYDLMNDLKEKLVYGESIAQTNQFITSKAAEIGFTAKSVVLSPTMKNQGNYTEIDEKAYDRIRQGIVRIKRTDAENKNTRIFYNFIFSPEAQQILKTNGYAIP